MIFFHFFFNLNFYCHVAYLLMSVIVFLFSPFLLSRNDLGAVDMVKKIDDSLQTRRTTIGVNLCVTIFII